METRVLVVDDDVVVGKSFERVLTDKGYKVDTALTGREAFEKFDGKDFDMVFTDLRMPGMDGIEVARRIKEMNPWLPIVMVTGYGTEEAEARAKAAGVTDVIHKPLTPSLIEEVAARLVGRKAAQKAEAAAAAEAAPPRGNVAKNVLLFLAAPFIGLAYMLAFPFVGGWMLAKWGFKALSGKKA